jgi:hypothetical protein
MLGAFFGTEAEALAKQSGEAKGSKWKVCSEMYVRDLFDFSGPTQKKLSV